MGKAPQVGELAPDFELPGVAGGAQSSYRLSDHRGRPVVLAFYPGDDTPVCTRQLCSYQDRLGDLTDLGAQVWGISTQDLASHERFAAKRGLGFPLLADPGKEVVSRYGAKGALGTKRSVFVVDAEGVLRWAHVAAIGLTYQDVDTIAGVLRGLAPAA